MNESSDLSRASNPEISGMQEMPTVTVNTVATRQQQHYKLYNYIKEKSRGVAMEIEDSHDKLMNSLKELAEAKLQFARVHPLIIGIAANETTSMCSQAQTLQNQVRQCREEMQKVLDDICAQSCQDDIQYSVIDKYVQQLNEMKATLEKQCKIY